MQTIMVSFIYGVGKGTGNILGGGLFQTITPTRTYVMFAVVSFAVGIFLSIVSLLLSIVPGHRRVLNGYNALPKQGDNT